MNITFHFSAPITNGSGPTSWGITIGSGTCQTNAPPGDSKTASLDGSGGGPVTRCGSMVLTGTYAIFFEGGAPLPSSGNITYVGTASGGVALMTGSTPTFVGVAVLAGAGMVACSTNGTSDVPLTGTLTFVDP